jgi:uncharacterized membrane protein YjgN (DUF898 family)
MIADALKFPVAGDEAIKSYLIGVILNLLSFLILPGFLLYGFWVRSVQATVYGKESAPAFKQWRLLLQDGYKCLVIALGFVIPFVPIAVLVAVLMTFMMPLGASAMANPTSVITGAQTAILVGGLIYLLTFGLFAYLLAAGLTQFAANRSMDEAFTLANLRELVFSVSFLGGFLLSFVLWVLVMIVNGVLNVMVHPAAAYLVTPFLYFYLIVFSAHLLGRGYVAATESNGRSQSTGQSPKATNTD